MAISGSYAAGDEIILSEAEVDIDLGATGSFAEIESWTVSVAQSGGEVATGNQPVLTGTQIVTTGAKAPITLTVTVIYTEGATDPFYNIYEAYNAGSNSRKAELKWNKKAATTGDYRFTSSGGKLTHCSLPVPDASGAGTATFTFTIQCSSVTRATI